MNAIEQVEQKQALFDETIELIAVFAADKDIYVPLKQFCDELGINWRSQSRRTTKHHTFGPVVRVVYVTGAYGTRPQQCLPLHYLGG